MKYTRIMGLGLVLASLGSLAQAKGDYPKFFTMEQLKSSKMTYTLPVRMHHHHHARTHSEQFEFIDTTAANIVGDVQYSGKVGVIPSYWKKNAQHGFERGEPVLVPVHRHHDRKVEYVYGIVLGKSGDIYVVQINKNTNKYMPMGDMRVEVAANRIYKFDANKYKQIVGKARENMQDMDEDEEDN